MGPTDDQAMQFCIMLQAGLPAIEALRYFTETEDPIELNMILNRWTRSAKVRKATVSLQGKSWTEMNLDEKIKAALDLHYAGLAFFLYSHNFSEVGPTDKAKVDTARVALEAKVAGTAGKGDALSRFFDDLNSGRIKLNPPTKSSSLIN